MQCPEDRVGIGQAVWAYVYRTESTKESRKSCECVTQKAPHGTREHTMSPATRCAKKHAKARHRRYLQAQERLARDRRQAQHAAEALQQALDDLGLPEDLVTEIEGRLHSQHKLLGKIVGVMFPPLFGCRTNTGRCFKPVDLLPSRSQREPSTRVREAMIIQVLHCPYCQGSDIVKHGMSPEGKQRYRCRACLEGRGRTFLLEYSYAGQSPEVKQQIVDMAMNASGIRDTARVLHVSPTTVIKELKKRT